jgi:DNA-binding response OmpR family regulator
MLFYLFPHALSAGLVLTSASPATLKDHEKGFADDFIEKPFDLNLLDQKIKFLLSSIPIRSPLFT